jgi:hypothetical protein
VRERKREKGEKRKNCVYLGLPNEEKKSKRRREREEKEEKKLV